MIGELATAAGLSAFALVAGPVFYLAHEIAWNRYGASSEAAVAVRLPLLSSENRMAGDRGELAISRALAKTITFRTIATAMDFTANYVVVGDLAAPLLFRSRHRGAVPVRAGRVFELLPAALDHQP